MTQLEIDILAFSRNNPKLDTASDIIRCRMLPKANVSQAVELLIQKEMLKRTPDESDRRKIHLSIRPEAQDLLAAIIEGQNAFWEMIFTGIPQDEREHFMKLNHMVVCNVKKRIGECGNEWNRKMTF